MNTWLRVVPLALALLAGQPGIGTGFGSFVGDVVARWLDPDRRMQLTEDFAYLDPGGKRWHAPKNSIVDGASIPQVFWTFVGGPFEGLYRKASVVHDVACVERREKWEDVHRMFYYAMRAGGVGETRAAVMYAAVYKFGPRWDEPKGFWSRLGGGLKGIFTTSSNRESAEAPPPPPPAPVSEADVKALNDLMEQNTPRTPEEVERLIRP